MAKSFKIVVTGTTEDTGVLDADFGIEDPDEVIDDAFDAIEDALGGVSGLATYQTARPEVT